MTIDNGPITIARQGSFFVGGREIHAEGMFDPTSPHAGGEGESYWIDQMYVQYQVPLDARKLPLVLVHGGGGTGQVWESTPDGREGFQSIFLRRGHAVYIVDSPRGGRAGFPSFDGVFGKLDGRQVVEARTRRPGRGRMWSRWRLGPKYPDSFADQAFPMDAVPQFLKHVRPMVSDDAEVISQALALLLVRIGPAVLVTHSNSGLPGWLAGCRCSLVRGIVSYEPGFVFPEAEMPEAIPLYSGSQACGNGVTQQEFIQLSTLPIQVVYGDNIPQTATPDLIADGRRAQVITSKLFVQALNRDGGRAEVLHLPQAGLRGNSHFMFSDLNNLEVADMLSAFLERHGLDER